MWQNLAADFASCDPDAELNPCKSVDDCVMFIVEQCNMTLDIRLQPSVVMADIAHICPHVLEPSVATASVFLFTHRVEHAVGHHGARLLRAAIVRRYLRLPGEAQPPLQSDLLQDCSHMCQYAEHEFRHTDRVSTVVVLSLHLPCQAPHV